MEFFDFRQFSDAGDRVRERRVGDNFDELHGPPATPAFGKRRERHDSLVTDGHAGQCLYGKSPVRADREPPH